MMEDKVDFNPGEEESQKQNPQDFELDENLEYSRKGDWETTAVIVMNPPTMKEFDEFSHLSQLCMRAVSDIQNRQNRQKNISPEDIENAKKLLDDKKSSDDPMKADEIKMILYSSSSVSFIDISNSFKRLACKVCYVANDTPMTPVMFDKFTPNKFVEMVCTYVANFITPSLL